MRVSRSNTAGLDSSMQSSSADNLPSLSATCPTTTALSREKATLNGYHDVTKPFFKSSDITIRATRKPVTSKTNDSTVRAAKKEISGKVKEDWTWSPTQSQPGLLSIDSDNTNEWRERESDSEYEPPSPVANTDPYRFDNPDSVAQPVLSKKRKRRLLLEDEMQWNQGLHMYTQRRNAWVGAKILPPSSPTLDSPLSETQTSTDCEDSQLPMPPSPIPPVQSISSSSLPTTLVPIAPPILPPDHPIRASIKPSAYPSIYDKIVVRGLSPTIPVNLKDVVHALVAGWKKDGEWPPKSEAEKAGDAEGNARGARGEGKRLARRGVGRVKRVLGLGRGIDDPGRGER